MAYAPLGKGPVLYVLAYSTCPYASAFLNDWNGKLANIQLRFSFYGIDQNTANAASDVALTRDPAVVSAILLQTRTSPSAYTSKEAVNAYNLTLNSFNQLNQVFSSFRQYHVISPTFVWRNGGTVFVSRGYDRQAFQSIILKSLQTGNSPAPPQPAISNANPGSAPIAQNVRSSADYQSARTPLPSENILDLDGILKRHNGDGILKIEGVHAVLQSPDYTRENVIIDGVFQPRQTGGVYRGMRDMVLWPNSHVRFLQISALTDNEHDVLHLVVASDLGAFAPISFLLPKGALSPMSKEAIMKTIDPFIAFAAADANTFRKESGERGSLAKSLLRPSRPPEESCMWVPYVSKKWSLELLREHCTGGRNDWKLNDVADGIGMSTEGPADSASIQILSKPTTQVIETAIQQQIIAKFHDSAARNNCRATRLLAEEEPGWHEYEVQPFGAYAHPKLPPPKQREKGDGELCEGLYGADTSSVFLYNPEISKTHFFALYGLSDLLKGQPFDIFSLRFLSVSKGTATAR